MSEEETTWTKLLPSLAEVDLLPYLFLVKDENSVCLGSSFSSEVEEIFKALKAGEFAAASCKERLNSLSIKEVQNLYSALEEEIKLEAHFEKMPSALSGLRLFVTERQEKAQDLLSLLIELSKKPNIGTWILSGWAGALGSDELKSQYREQVVRPLCESNNPMMKTIAKQTLSEE